MIASLVRRASQWLCLCLLVCGSVAVASPRILNGTPTEDFASVGTVRSLDDFGNGVLVTPGRVVTSAHLVYNRDPFDLTCTFAGKDYAVVAIAVHPDFSVFDRRNNLAILVLAKPVSDVTPSPLLETAPTVGATLTLVGFGRGGDDDGFSGELGTKRKGTTTLDDLDADELIWNFETPGEANVGDGDSGSGVFVGDGDGGYLLAGIVSRHLVDTGELGDTAYATRTDAALAWLTDFDTLPQTVVYRATESLRVFSNAGARQARWRGYAVLDVESGELWAVQAYREDGDWVVEVEPLHAGGTIFATEVPDGKRVIASLTQQQLTLGPGAGAWRQLEGEVSFPMQGRYYARTLRGPSLVIESLAPFFARGQMVLRFDSHYTADAFGVEAEDMAYHLGGILAAQKGVAAPVPAPNEIAATTTAAIAPADLPPGAVRVYKVRGRELARGDGELLRSSPRGYLIYQESTGATQLLLTGLANEGTVHTRIDTEFLNVFDFTVAGEHRYQTTLTASDFLFHPFDLVALFSSTVTDERPANNWRGSWTIADTGWLSRLTFRARINRGLTTAAGVDFDGTVTALANELGIDDEEDED